MYLIPEEMDPKDAIAFVYDNGMSISAKTDGVVGGEDSAVVEVKIYKKRFEAGIAVTCLFMYLHDCWKNATCLFCFGSAQFLLLHIVNKRMMA